MTLRTALIIDGDSTSGKKALDDLNASLTRSDQDAAAAAKSYSELDVAATRAGAGHAEMNRQVNQNRTALLELQHIARGTTDQLAAGAPISQIFAQHMGMIGEAAGLAGGSLGKFGEFMAGPWGIAVTAGISLGTLLITSILSTSNAVADETKKLEDNAKGAVASEQAHKAFSGTIDGVTEALHKNQDALKGIIDGEKSAAEKALSAAIAAKARLDIIDQTTASLIKQAQAELELNNAQALGPETKNGRADPNLAAADAARSRLAALQATLPDLTSKLNDAQQQIDQATAAVYAQAAGKDPVERIKDEAKAAADAATAKATRQAEAARAAGDEAKAQRLITTELQAQVKAINDKRDADVKAYEAAHKTGPANAGGTAIANDQTAAFFDIASRYRGQSETANRASLQSFLGGVDPEKTAWCAAFVNAVLASGGVRGTVLANGKPNLAAASFLNYGQNDVASPQKGDIVILKGAAGDHVGFLDSIDKKGNVSVLAGNTGNKVAEATYSASSVLAIRRPLSPSESAAADDKAETAEQRAAEQALQQQGTFNSERDRLNQQYLAELGKVALGAEAQATVQLAQVKAQHDAEAGTIATNLAEGKYGTATSQLAKDRAQQLTVANDNLLQEQQAAIGLGSYIKSLQGLDDANERNSKYEIDGLQYQESIAKTAGERRDLQLEIIDIEYKEKESHLKYLLWLDTLTGNTKDAADAAAQLAQLPAEKARDQDKAKRDTMGPLAKWETDIPQSAKEIGDALENEAVKGINDLNDGLANAIVNSKSLGEVFHNVAASILADLVKIALQQAEMAIFKMAIGAIAGAAGGAAGGGGGINVTPGGGSDAILAGLAPRAAGGPVDAGTPYLVGEKGMEIFVPNSSGTIVPNHQLSSSGMRAANDSGPSINVPISITNDFRGAAPEAVAQLSAKLDRVQRELPGTIVSTMQDARTRLAWRS